MKLMSTTLWVPPLGIAYMNAKCFTADTAACFHILCTKCTVRGWAIFATQRPLETMKDVKALYTIETYLWDFVANVSLY